jgi:tetratricopeptide (TPR) repeat protein
MMHLNANWAVLEQRQGNLSAAREHYAQALDVAEQLGGSARPAAAGIYANAAQLALTSGDRDRAGDYAKRALSGLEGWAATDLPALRLAREVRDALDA